MAVVLLRCIAETAAALLASGEEQRQMWRGAERLSSGVAFSVQGPRGSPPPGLGSGGSCGKTAKNNALMEVLVFH